MAIQTTIANIFIDLIPDMCFVISGDSMVLACNQSARELLGLPDVSVTPLNFYDLLTDDSPKPLLAILRTKEESPEAEVMFKGPEGKMIDAMLSIKKISGPEKDFLYVIARDVSEAKK